MDASEQIDRLIAGITDWRGKKLARVRNTVLEADREIIEEWQCKVKLTFMHGAMLAKSRKAKTGKAGKKAGNASK